MSSAFVISINIIIKDNAAIEDIHHLFNTLIIPKNEVFIILTSDDSNSEVFFNDASPFISFLSAIVALLCLKNTLPLILQNDGAPLKYKMAPFRLNTFQPPF